MVGGIDRSHELDRVFGLGVEPAVVSSPGGRLDARVPVRKKPRSRSTFTGLVRVRAPAWSSLLVAAAAPVRRIRGCWDDRESLNIPASEAHAAAWLFRAQPSVPGGMLVGARVSGVLDAVGRVDLDAAANGFITVANAGFLLAAVLIQPPFAPWRWCRSQLL